MHYICGTYLCFNLETLKPLYKEVFSLYRVLLLIDFFSNKYYNPQVTRPPTVVAIE